MMMTISFHFIQWKVNFITIEYDDDDKPTNHWIEKNNETKNILQQKKNRILRFDDSWKHTEFIHKFLSLIWKDLSKWNFSSFSEKEKKNIILKLGKQKITFFLGKKIFSSISIFFFPKEEKIKRNLFFPRWFGLKKKSKC